MQTSTRTYSKCQPTTLSYTEQSNDYSTLNKEQLNDFSTFNKEQLNDFSKLNTKQLNDSSKLNRATKRSYELIERIKLPQ